MNETTDLYCPPWVITRNIGGRTVLYQSDAGEVFYLDGTASAVWGWVMDHKRFTLDALIAAMQSQFEGDAGVIAGDVSELVGDLFEQGVLLPAPDDP